MHNLPRKAPKLLSPGSAPIDNRGDEGSRGRSVRIALARIDSGGECDGEHGCQMAIAGFLDRMCLALRASRLWLRYAALQNLIPSFPLIAPGWRAGDQILPSVNTDLE